ncbi:ECF RNA polymerase sigma factor SigJ [Gemmata sp. SH-PL17]|uniref:RNA polymerase sigma-70 factor n=1 Tax=Gemmata sp. SH-PL17 TaxID=1630693 RepID=UPI00078EDA43|nr:RNA polymerase sigma-70 factor [Gemmata sp. SH-PL17]AMV27176.1 ECF RNA polymerase sigma factor SigJ [Gemmata sp. SH-PL17]
MSEPSPHSAENLRPKLLAVAYRMLGTVADAEDAVQDAYLRYQQHAAEVESPEAWLVKTTTRVCIDRLRKTKREEYVGQWLPEPVADSWAGATDRTELADSLSMAFLVLLETLSPTERATYLLREVFGYEFDEIAELLDKSPVNIRQIAARAKKRLDTRERRFDAAPERVSELADRFFTACRSGDVGAIESMLTSDATLFSDGGGKTHAAPRPVIGTRRIANLLAVVFRKLRQLGDLAPATVNGAPGMVFTIAGRPVEVLTFAAREDRVDTLFVVLNPDKLSRWPLSPSADDDGTYRPGPWEKNRNGSSSELPEARS